MITIFRLRAPKRDGIVSASVPVLHEEDIPHGRWGDGEWIERAEVRVGGGEHTEAIRNSAERAFADDAETFADIAHDDGGMVALYDLLEGHTALWATGMPVGTSRAEARRFLLACVDALAERMRAVVTDTISEDIALPWGECDGGEE